MAKAFRTLKEIREQNNSQQAIDQLIGYIKLGVKSSINVIFFIVGFFMIFCIPIIMLLIIGIMCLIYKINFQKAIIMIGKPFTYAFLVVFGLWGIIFICISIINWI